MGQEADAARSGAGVTTCCPPRLTQPLLCATHCWGGVSTVGRGQTRCLSRSVAWLRGQRVTTQSPSPMVSKGSNLEEENESGGVFNKYSAANLEATGTQRDETTAGAGGAACPVCLHRQAAGPAASPGCGGSAFPRRQTPPDPRALVVCPEFHAGRRRPASLAPPRPPAPRGHPGPSDTFPRTAPVGLLAREHPGQDWTPGPAHPGQHSARERWPLGPRADSQSRRGSLAPGDCSLRPRQQSASSRSCQGDVKASEGPSVPVYPPAPAPHPAFRYSLRRVSFSLTRFPWLWVVSLCCLFKKKARGFTSRGCEDVIVIDS